MIGAVQPAPAALIRAAFDLSNPAQPQKEKTTLSSGLFFLELLARFELATSSLPRVQKVLQFLTFLGVSPMCNQSRAEASPDFGYGRARRLPAFYSIAVPFACYSYR